LRRRETGVVVFKRSLAVIKAVLPHLRAYLRLGD
jgi:hypothetical protein